jgi:histidine phosphotransfer protein HptB
MDTPVIDPLIFEALQANAGADFVQQLVDAFVEEGPTLVSQLRRAAANGDADGFVTTAHTLKCNGITFGASRLAGLAGRLEWQGVAAGGPAIDALAAELAAALALLPGLARQ